MKREALNHTKMKRLCRRLNLPLWQGVGILETLWQLTAKQAPRGDIGRLSNEDIAIGLDYRENDLILWMSADNWNSRVNSAMRQHGTLRMPPRFTKHSNARSTSASGSELLDNGRFEIFG